MSKQDSLVKNASSKKQVEKAEKKVKSQRDLELADLQSVVKTEFGRRFLWRILGECNVFGTVWHPSAAIHYNSGKQDVGHWLMSELADADETAIFRMMQENYKKGELNA